MKTEKFLSGFLDIINFAEVRESPFLNKIAYEEKSAVAADLAITFLISYKNI